MSHDVLQSIISEIETKIDGADLNPQIENVGEVFYLGDGVAKVSGLRSSSYNEVLEFDSGAIGVALNLEDHYVGVVVLSGFTSIREGDTVKTTGRTLEVPVGPEMVGRVVDALGRPIDGLGEIKSKENYPVERQAE